MKIPGIQIQENLLTSLANMSTSTCQSKERGSNKWAPTNLRHSLSGKKMPTRLRLIIRAQSFCIQTFEMNLNKIRTEYSGETKLGTKILK